MLAVPLAAEPLGSNGSSTRWEKHKTCPACKLESCDGPLVERGLAKPLPIHMSKGVRSRCSNRRPEGGVCEVLHFIIHSQAKPVSMSPRLARECTGGVYSMIQQVVGCMKAVVVCTCHGTCTPETVAGFACSHCYACCRTAYDASRVPGNSRKPPLTSASQEGTMAYSCSPSISTLRFK